MNPTAKRPRTLRQPQPAASYDATAASVEDADVEEPDDLWSQRAFFALDRYDDPDALQYQPDAWDSASSVATGGIKRGTYALITSLSSEYDAEYWFIAALGLVSSDVQDGDTYTEEESTAPVPAWLAQAFPELCPTVPARGEQTFSLNLRNPFATNGTNRHPGLKRTALIPEGGAVNGYIKFRLRMSDVEDQNSPVLGKGKGLANSQPPNLMRQPLQHMQHNPNAPPIDIPYLPPNFGRRLKLDDTDNKLLKFCT